MSEPFRVVVAPDKFKGSLPATEVAGIVSAVLRARCPTAAVRQHPVADGGEGTVDVSVAAGFSPVTVTVTGPLGDPVEATFAIRDGVAILEMASAAGLSLLPGGPDRCTARNATTYGVGELILAALDQGADEIVVGAGGSATTDGGAGALEALGLDVAALGRRPQRPGVVRTGLDPRLSEVDLVVACDVDNPLLGPDGAAHTYAPQKGADPELVADLETRLERWADAVAAASGSDLRNHPGAGAAGGFAFGLVALAQARVVSGVQLLLELTGFDEVAGAADLVVVGEGSLDRQSLRGKGPLGVARSASASRSIVVAVAGRNELTEAESRAAGLAEVYALTDIEPDAEICMRDATRLLGKLAHRVADDWLPCGSSAREPR